MQSELADSFNFIFFQMKKTFKFFAVALVAVAMVVLPSCNRSDVDSATYKTLEIGANDFKYDANGFWAEAYDSTLTAWNVGDFYFIHAGTTVPYPYWEGFTPSVAQKDDAENYGYYSCVAKGGVKGVGSPYVLGFWSEFTGGLTTVIMVKDGEKDSSAVFVPQEVYLCNATQTHKDVKEGTPFGKVNGYEAGDYFVVKVRGIKGISATGYELTDNSVDYYMADFRDGKSFINEAWEKVDLKDLGQVIGLKFDIDATDKGTFGINTATYFALDGLKIKIEK